MTATEALTKIRVMLGIDEPITEGNVETQTEQIEVTLAEAELLDGTKVMVEGDLEPGNILLVDGGEGAEPLKAPEGVHETTDGKLITVDAEGVIISVEDKPAEEEVTQEAELSEDLVSQVVTALKPSLDRLNEMADELNNLKAQFSAFKDEPAGSKITNNLNENNKQTDSVIEAKLRKLKAIRNNNIKLN